MDELIDSSHICFRGSQRTVVSGHLFSFDFAAVSGRWTADAFSLLILRRTAVDGLRTSFSLLLQRSADYGRWTVFLSLHAASL